MKIKVTENTFKQCGPIIRKIRCRQEKSLPYMSEVTGKSVQQLSMFELGRCGISLGTMIRLINELNLKMSVYGDGLLYFKELSNGEDK